ncbi:B12-binding domain-containing radical SAM protein [Tistrella arctica]
MNRIDSMPRPATGQVATGARLGLLLIKPSHYDEDGYVIQWRRSFIPAHVLAVVEGIFQDAAGRAAPGVASIETRAINEASSVVRPAKLIAWLRGFDRAAVMMIGVQSSQFPRALDLSRDFVAAGFPVVIGGFHISGSMSMVPGWEPAFTGAAEAGVTLYAGELECGVDALVADLVAGTIRPLYNHLKSTADMGLSPQATLGTSATDGTLNGTAGMDVGRGCPFQCSFCTIINVHGRTMRNRDPSSIEAYLRDCAARGIHNLMVTDDNFARSPIWREVTEIMARLQRELGIEWDAMIQVDTLATRMKGFVEACKAAGVKRVFIGMESVRPDNLKAASKGQNKVHQMRDMIMAWKEAGIMIYAGVIIGFPADTPERIAEDIRTFQTDIPIDVIEIFALTPLPGSEDHQRLVAAGVDMDLDLNRYDTVHVVTDHPRMTRDAWTRLYWQSWEMFYTTAHMKTLIGRAILYKLPLGELRTSLLGFVGAVRYERVHPVDGGLFRIRNRLSRRRGHRVVPALPHALIRAVEITVVQSRFLMLLARILRCEAAVRWDLLRGRRAPYLCAQTPAPARAAPDLAAAAE